MTLSEIWPEFIQFKTGIVRPQTVSTYVQEWERSSDFFGPMDVENISTKEVEKWVLSMLDRKFSKKYICCIITLINCMLDYAAYEKDIKVQKILKQYIRWPSAVLKIEDVEKKKIYTPEELKKIVDHVSANPRPDWLLICLVLNTGLRIGEACALTFADIDTVEGVVTVSGTVGRIMMSYGAYSIPETTIERNGQEVISGGKTSKLVKSPPKTKTGYRRIPIVSALLKIYKPFKKIYPAHYYLGTFGPKPIDPRCLREHYKDLVLKEVKLDHCIKFHGLRHTFASMLVTSGVDVRTAAELLGHSDPSVTLSIYSHSNIEAKKKAVGQAIKKLF